LISGAGAAQAGPAANIAATVKAAACLAANFACAARVVKADRTANVACAARAIRTAAADRTVNNAATVKAAACLAAAGNGRETHDWIKASRLISDT
jgi:hypothetical protein